MYTSGNGFYREIWLEVDRENDWEMEKILKIGEKLKNKNKMKVKIKVDNGIGPKPWNMITNTHLFESTLKLK